MAKNPILMSSARTRDLVSPRALAILQNMNREAQVCRP